MVRSRSLKSNWEISCFGWDKIYGVYCVCEKINEKIHIHYIGSSKDIGKRLQNNKHPYKILLQKDCNVFIKFKQVENYLELEKRLINKIRPKYNKHHYNG